MCLLAIVHDSIAHEDESGGENAHSSARSLAHRRLRRAVPRMVPASAQGVTICSVGDRRANQSAAGPPRTRAPRSTPCWLPDGRASTLGAHRVEVISFASERQRARAKCCWHSATASKLAPAFRTRRSALARPLLRAAAGTDPAMRSAIVRAAPRVTADFRFARATSISSVPSSHLLRAESSSRAAFRAECRSDWWLH